MFSEGGSTGRTNIDVEGSLSLEEVDERLLISS